MCNLYNFNFIIKSCRKWIEIDYSDPISRRREIAGPRRLRALWRLLSVASFVLTFSPVRLRLERKLRAVSVGYFMYYHLVY